MEITEAEKILLKNRYKRDPSSTISTRYYYKRTTDSDCQCNERPPNIGVTLHDINFNGTEHYTSMKINIRAEAVNGQWVDTGYYSLPLEEIKSISTYEYTITKMWEAAN